MPRKTSKDGPDPDLPGYPHFPRHERVRTVTSTASSDAQALAAKGPRYRRGVVTVADAEGQLRSHDTQVTDNPRTPSSQRQLQNGQVRHDLRRPRRPFLCAPLIERRCTANAGDGARRLTTLRCLERFAQVTRGVAQQRDAGLGASLTAVGYVAMFVHI